MIKETMASIKKAEKQGEEIVNKANEDAENNIKAYCKVSPKY